VTNIPDESKVVFELERTCARFCGQCGCVCAKKHDSKTQEILIAINNLKKIYARLEVCRVRCPLCGIVTERHGVSEGKKRHSKEVEEATIHYTQKLDNASVAELFGLSEMTIYRIDYDGLSKLQDQYLKELPKPEKLSVDEASHKRRHCYATIISDYDEADVLWLENGRKQADLERGFDQLGNSLSDVTAVAVDLWRAYENAITIKLPKAAIVYDRFHISRLLNQSIEFERRHYQKLLTDKDRKLMKKHSRWILLKREFNLTVKNKDHLEELKNANTTLYEMYLLKESFLNIFDSYSSKKFARRQVFNWIREIFKTEFEHLKRFARSIIKRMRNILNWFACPISNGKAEGINNVIKTLLKRAYGYKNFDYFRMKVLQKCGRLMDYGFHTFC
jgi:transposase